MSDAERIAAIKGQALALIEIITASPKPNYRIDGQSVSWGRYLQQLLDTVAWCDRHLAGAMPFEIRSQATT